MFRHEHAYKLDEPERQRWLPTADVLERLAVRPGMTIADVGAGTGYFALPMARAVLPGGRIYADDTAAALVEARRILRPGGSIAILDWRTDVEQPPGPPLSHRVSATDTAASLRFAGWNVAAPETIGMYSHLVLATRPPS